MKKNKITYIASTETRSADCQKRACVGNIRPAMQSEAIRVAHRVIKEHEGAWRALAKR